MGMCFVVRLGWHEMDGWWPWRSLTVHLYFVTYTCGLTLSTLVSLPMSTLQDTTNKVLWDSCIETRRDVPCLFQWRELLSSRDARTSISSCILCKSHTIDKSAHLAWCCSAGTGPWSALRALRVRVLLKTWSKGIEQIEFVFAHMSKGQAQCDHNCRFGLKSLFPSCRNLTMMQDNKYWGMNSQSLLIVTCRLKEMVLLMYWLDDYTVKAIGVCVTCRFVRSCMHHKLAHFAIWHVTHKDVQKRFITVATVLI